MWRTAVCLGCLAALGCSKPHSADSAGSAAQPFAADPGTAQPVRSSPETTPKPATPQPPVDERSAERDRMVERQMKQRGIEDPRVLAALRRVPRHRFVPEQSRAAAYADRPLPIGSGQTISQPYIVALMTELARPTERDRCLEIGTGSGYQAAILAEVCGKTYSIEYLEPVARFGESNLRKSGYGPERVQLRVGDGYRGWPEAAPFDVIIVTAAPESVPEPLLEQLAVGGRLVVPIGGQSSGQQLQRWTRHRAGKGRGAFEVEDLLPVRFVPFLGDAVER
jgi:protein-L-isoaspartate(D-aspartate) O-methyltransferase